MRPHPWNALLLVGALSAVGAGCADDSDTSHVSESSTLGADQDADATDTSGTTDGEEIARETRPSVDPSDETVELTETEIAGLLWMREEEQLAHDVYTALGADWGLRIFDNIARSELDHVERVAALLDRYGIDDPLAGASEGTFTIPEMQDMYDELVADGRQSLIDALAVGALIEEIDIVDLRSRATDVPDIRAAYNRLERGSRNHLRAFTSQLEARDAPYEPTQLDIESYEAIVSGEMERGASPSS